MTQDNFKSFTAGLKALGVIALFITVGVLISMKANRHRYGNEIARLAVLHQLVADEAEKNNRKFIGLNHDLTLLQKSTVLLAQINRDLLRIYLHDIESADPSVLANLNRRIIFPQKKLLHGKSLPEVSETVTPVDPSFDDVDILHSKNLNEAEL